jgi:hypothetical protein
MNTPRGTTTFDKPADNIGGKTISNYVTYANKHVWDIRIPGCDGIGRVFVGQRRDPFVVNPRLKTFDLVNIKFPATELNPLAEVATVDSLVDNKHHRHRARSADGPALPRERERSSAAGQRRAFRRRARGKCGDGGARRSAADVGQLCAGFASWRAAGQRARHRAEGQEQVQQQQSPKTTAKFLDYVTNPTLPALLEILFGSAGVKAPTNFPRSDLVAAFLTGVDTLNKPANVTGSEMLRLNTAIPPKTGRGAESPRRARWRQCRISEWPAPGDDVVDIELRVAMGVLCTLNIGGCKPSDAPAGNAALHRWRRSFRRRSSRSSFLSSSRLFPDRRTGQRGKGFRQIASSGAGTRPGRFFVD